MLIDAKLEKIKPGELYFFVKSGNWVRTIKRIKDGFWHVQRVDKEKDLIVSERALISNPEEYDIEVSPNSDPRKKE